MSLESAAIQGDSGFTGISSAHTRVFFSISEYFNASPRLRGRVKRLLFKIQF